MTSWCHASVNFAVLLIAFSPVEHISILEMIEDSSQKLETKICMKCLGTTCTAVYCFEQ